jgi:hypothetical protein
MQHLARLFLNAHAAQQIGRAQFGGQAPVFVRGQFAVAIKIAETQALDGDDRFAAAFNHRLFGDGPWARPTGPPWEPPAQGEMTS